MKPMDRAASPYMPAPGEARSPASPASVLRATIFPRVTKPAPAAITISIDKFTPWAKTGHAKRFSEALNGGGYGPSCFKCHTVGFRLNSNLASFPASTISLYTYISSNGIQDQASYAAFLADSQFMAQAGQPALGSDSSRYAMLWSNATYSQIAQRTNIQCENCHGPQESGAGVDSPAHTGSISGVWASRG